MSFDWEEVIGVSRDLGDVYDEKASDALYQDHPAAAPAGGPIDDGDDVVVLPFHEE